jgi:hypothetical protein
LRNYVTDNDYQDGIRDDFMEQNGNFATLLHENLKIKRSDLWFSGGCDKEIGDMMTGGGSASCFRLLVVICLKWRLIVVRCLTTAAVTMILPASARRL